MSTRSPASDNPSPNDARTRRAETVRVLAEAMLQLLLRRADTRVRVDAPKDAS